MDLDRRRFLASTACAAAAMACGEYSAFAKAAVEGRPLSLRIDPSKMLGEIPPDFLGLGYEISSVARTGLLSARNSAYVQFVKSLSSRGVIRIGGNTSDYSSYSANGPAVSAPKATVVDEAVIRDLGGFLDATGWQLIWGLNLGDGTIDNAVDEAASVIAAAKGKLLAIEIGNEPDLFAGSVAHRDKGYVYADYHKEYRAYKAALRAKFPNVPFAGPDAASHTDWVTQFALDEGADLKLLTHHYYAEGPPTNPTSTIEKLLGPADNLARMLMQCEAASLAANVPYRICETNSCFGGGKPGVSDTLASALWGLDYMFTMAAASCAGTNIETGINQLGFVSSYSPIGDDLAGHYTAKPIYYAMLAFAQASRGMRIAVDYDAAAMNVKTYAVRDSAGRVFVTMINKEAVTDAVMSVALPRHSGSASVLRLAGPALDSKTGITLGGAEVSADGKWMQAKEESVHVRNGAFEVHLPAASAAILIAPK
jgi:hypothetical protein